MDRDYFEKPDTAGKRPRTARDWLARNGVKGSIDAITPAKPAPTGQPDGQNGVGDGVKRSLPKASEITVGIVGAGCAGLYAAMILKSLEIKFELLEGSDRVGGRVYTHRFSDAPHDYFDVGAMRFPRLWFMRRLIVDLFDNRLKFDEQKKVVPYYLGPKEGHSVRWYYNKQPFAGTQLPMKVDTFGFAKDDKHPENGVIPIDYVNKGPEALLKASFRLLLEPFIKMNQAGIDDEQRTPLIDEADSVMRKIDTFTARSWLKLYGVHPDDIGEDGSIKGLGTLDELLAVKDTKGDMGYSPAVIQWIETTQTGTTGWYDMALSQTIMEAADFGEGSLDEEGNAWVPDDGPYKGFKWACVDGGSEEITKGMLELTEVNAADIINKKVTAVKKRDDKLDVSFFRKDKDGNEVKDTEAFDQVICTATLGCMATMDLDNVVSYTQSVAIRCLQYDASCKIGVKFTTRWWQDEKVMGQGQTIYGGVSKSDLPLSNVVYPSYGADDPADATGVLICSYTWAQDAKRLGALIGQGGKMSTELRAIVVRDLAKIHRLAEGDIDSRIVSSYCYAWYNDPSYRGAFAIFGPSQFYDTVPADKGVPADKDVPAEKDKYVGASLFDSVKVPGPGGRFHIAGEATSTHHGWIIGALNSGWRAVNNVIKGCSDQEELYALLLKKWGLPDEEPDIKIQDKAYERGRLGVDFSVSRG